MQKNVFYCAAVVIGRIMGLKLSSVCVCPRGLLNQK